MANKNCLKLFGNSLLAKLKPDVIERLEKNIEVKKRQLETLAKTTEVDDLDASLIGGPQGDNAMKHIAKEVLENEVKLTKQRFKQKFVEADLVDDEMFTLHEAVRFFTEAYKKEGDSAIVKYFTEPEPITKALKNNDYGPLINRIFLGRMFDATYGYGGSLEKLKQSTHSLYWGQKIDKKLYDQTQDTNWLRNNASKKEEVISILDDLIAMQKDPTIKTSVNNSNTVQYQIAEAIRDSYKMMMKENAEIGGKMNFYNIVPKARLNANRLDTPAKQQEAIKDIADSLDDRTVFELTDLTSNASKVDIEDAKIKLATYEVERAVKGGRDQNAFGISTDKNKDYFIYKDGASVHKVISKWTQEEDFGSYFFTHIRKLTDQHALTKVAGGDPIQYLNKLETRLQKDPMFRPYVDDTGFKVMKSTIVHMVNPTKSNSNSFVRAISGFRNLNLVKLGFVPLDQLTVEPTLAFLRTVSDVQFSKKFNIVGNIGPLQGKKKRLAARFNGVAMETQIGAINNRLFGSFNESLNEGAFANVTGKISNNFIYYTGATWLSDGQAAATFNVYRMDISEAFKKGILWKNLDKKHQMFKNDLIRNGIDGDMWDQAMRGYQKGTFRNMDDGLGGLFDPALIETATKKLQARKISDYDAWMSYFQKKVDGFGRMRPGEQAQARLRMYTDSDTIGAVFKTMTQFKSFTMGFGQRIYGDANLKGGKLGVLKTATYLGIGLIPAAMVRVQMTEMAKGKPPLKWGEELWGRAVVRSGITGWLGLVFFDDFIKDALKSFNPEEYDEVSERQLVFSLMDDIAGITFSTLVETLAGGASTILEGIRQAAGDDDADVVDKGLAEVTDLMRSFAPNGVIISYLMNYMIYDVWQKMINEDAYYKRQSNIEKRMEENYSGGAQNLYEWLEQF